MSIKSAYRPMKLVSIVGASLTAVAATGFLSGLGGKWFFLWPVYDFEWMSDNIIDKVLTENIPPGYGPDAGQVTSYLNAAWCPDYLMPPLFAPQSSFAVRLWWMIPTLQLGALGIPAYGTRPPGYLGPVYQTGLTNWDSAPTAVTLSASCYYDKSDSSGTPYSPSNPPPLPPGGPLGDDFYIVLAAMFGTGVFLLVAGMIL
jgi:hypothetical protein